jgi:hypothetical protein
MGMRPVQGQSSVTRLPSGSKWTFGSGMANETRLAEQGLPVVPRARANDSGVIAVFGVATYGFSVPGLWARDILKLWRVAALTPARV